MAHVYLVTLGMGQYDDWQEHHVLATLDQSVAEEIKETIIANLWAFGVYVDGVSQEVKDAECNGLNHHASVLLGDLMGYHQGVYAPDWSGVKVMVGEVPLI
jgi:hypothetical protein